jgi:hypothetical protein
MSSRFLIGLSSQVLLRQLATRVLILAVCPGRTALAVTRPLVQVDSSAFIANTDGDQIDNAARNAGEESRLQDYVASQKNQKLMYDSIKWNGLYLGLAGLGGMLIADAMRKPYARTFGNAVTGLAWAAALGAYGSASSSAASSRDEDILQATHQRFLRASGQGAIGESSNLFLIPEGAYIHPIYNDVTGNTDKLLTASLKFGILRTWDRLSIETVGYWRLLTPSFKPEFNVPDLKKPVGRYADWTELKTSIATTSVVASLPVRAQVSVGYNDIGNKGGKEVHIAIHRITRNSIENLEYINQPEGRFLSLAGELGLSHPFYSTGWGIARGLFSISAEKSKIMDEVGLRWNAVHVITPEYWEYGVELRAVRQLASEAYEHLRPIRYEGGAGVRVMKYFSPTLKYVSSYLYGDDVGQTYFDVLHYNFTF